MPRKSKLGLKKRGRGKRLGMAKKVSKRGKKGTYDAKTIQARLDIEEEFGIRRGRKKK